MYYDVVQAEPRKGYRLFIKFADGTAGEVDVSHLVGKGVFKAWGKPSFFNKVYVDTEMRTVCWPGEIDLAPDALYEKISTQKIKRKAA